MVDCKAELWSIYYRTNIVLSVPYWINVKLCLLKMRHLCALCDTHIEDLVLM